MKRYKLKPKIDINPNDNVIVIDGKYLMYRTQYSHDMQELSYEGVKTGMLYGFLNSVRSIVKKFNPVNVVICWDSYTSVRRNEYPGYKIKDNKYLKDWQLEILSNMKAEYPHLISICEELGFVGYFLEGYEADDLIALFCKQYDSFNKIIITRDEDMYQLLNETTSMWSPDDKKLKNLRWFKNEYGIYPDQWALVKAYGGCKSDKVPGITGIGEGYAIKYIKGELKSGKMFDRINLADKKEVELWKRITVLPHPSVADRNIQYKTTRLDLDAYLNLCRAYNFRSLMEKVSDFEGLL